MTESESDEEWKMLVANVQGFLDSGEYVMDHIETVTMEDKEDVTMAIKLNISKKYKDGEPCSHRGCLNHITHPCENCGRIGGFYREEKECQSSIPISQKKEQKQE